MTMSAAQQEAINELSAMCEARGWLTPRNQMVHMFSHHQCDMICEENGLLWNKACSCGVISANPSSHRCSMTNDE